MRGGGLALNLFLIIITNVTVDADLLHSGRMAAHL